MDKVIIECTQYNINMKQILKFIINLVLGKDYFRNRAFCKASENLIKVGPEALAAYYKVGKKLNIDFVPMFGTLLGAYREHNFIPHDDDIDMALDIRFLTKELIDSLRDSGFEINRLYINSNYIGCQLPMIFKGLVCDIYFSYSDNQKNHIYLPLAIEGHEWSYSTKMNIYRSKDVKIPTYDGFTKCKFAGTEVTIPSNTEDILTSLYGPDFMVPKKGVHADPDVYQAPIHEVFYNCYPISFVLEKDLITAIVKKAKMFI